MSDVIERKYDVSADELYSAIEHAVSRLGYKVQVAAQGQHTLTFKTGLSMKTWSGQRMEAKAVRRSDGGATLFLSRRANAQLYDWGEQKDVTNKFFAAVATAVSEVGDNASGAAEVRAIESPSEPMPAPAATGPTVLGPDAENRFGTRAVDALREEEAGGSSARTQPRGEDFRRQSANAARATGRFLRAINWRTLTSFRFLFGNFIIAAILAAVASLVSPILGTVVLIAVFGLLVVGGAMNPNLVLYCPYCKKRVKMGATTCHHCGQVVVKAPS